jgi:DNA polymerase III subunit epsilon
VSILSTESPLGRPQAAIVAPPTFTAIDFETATRLRDSACAVGMVRVERGIIVRRESRLIRPRSSDFEFTWLHAIAWNDVVGEPPFEEIWPLIRELCDGVDYVAAHNASFDEGVLRACCEQSGLPLPLRPGVGFECTVGLARRVWAIYPTRLDVVAARLGVPLRHHDAASDAEACAQIVLRAHACEAA